MNSSKLTSNSVIEPLFILGAPRSGTTFLASLLASTRFGAPVETHFIIKYFYKLDSYGNLSDINNYSQLLSDILSERAVMQWQLDFDISKSHQLMSSAGGFSYSTLINQLMLSRSEMREHMTWGDKTPSYISNIRIIDSLFPNAKYIYIVRDGRDVALSVIERDWGPNNVYTASTYWTELNSESEVIFRLRAEGRLFDVRYEDLVADAKNITKTITSFLREDIGLKEIEALAKTVRIGSRYKWKKVMTSNDIRIFESISADTLDRLGYETNAERYELPQLKQYYYLLHDRLLWFKFMVKINLIDGIKIKYFGKKPFAE